MFGSIPDSTCQISEAPVTDRDKRSPSLTPEPIEDEAEGNSHLYSKRTSQAVPPTGSKFDYEAPSMGMSRPDIASGSSEMSGQPKRMLLNGPGRTLTLPPNAQTALIS